MIFTSPNGVDMFFEAIRAFGKDARVFACVRLATLGAKTAECLAQYGLTADFVPTVFTGRDLGLQLASYANLKEKKVLLLRSELASDELVEVLQQGGAHVRDVSIYTAVPQRGRCDRSRRADATGPNPLADVRQSVGGPRFL